MFHPQVPIPFSSADLQKNWLRCCLCLGPAGATSACKKCSWHQFCSYINPVQFFLYSSSVDKSWHASKPNKKKQVNLNCDMLAVVVKIISPEVEQKLWFLSYTFPLHHLQALALPRHQESPGCCSTTSHCTASGVQLIFYCIV